MIHKHGPVGVQVLGALTAGYGLYLLAGLAIALVVVGAVVLALGVAIEVGRAR